ncbi:sulfatase family protein [Motilimonas pumila]|uniref:Sulfatase N-terminal domain-containing protein n=1 Tax=Motilimonas pumila TaxID=2303987 RepID=A0A418YJ45_9GAMM|nr:sulfatase [Motilimonas pumila]RJG50637.1 hypothetical protein D1Z90_03965 [Motilimonas pumila]
MAYFVRSLLLALIFSLALVGHAYYNFSMGGPAIDSDLLQQFWVDVIRSIGKLLAASGLTAWLLIYGTQLSYRHYVQLKWLPKHILIELIFIASSSAAIILLLLCHFLIYNPSRVVINFSYDMKWLNMLQPMLNEANWVIGVAVLAVVLVTPLAINLISVFSRQRFNKALNSVSFLFLATLAGVFYWNTWHLSNAVEPSPDAKVANTHTKLNVIMLGADTLRADRLGAYGYSRNNISPNIDRLAAKSLVADRMYVPLARTAPSLTSIFTSRYPWQHKVRTNFVQPAAVDVSQAFPEVLNKAGYTTSVVGDWAATDLGKLDFGFQRQLLPADQWNIKTLIAQGPKNSRLFLSLFWSNEIGRLWLPEIFYVAGTSIDGHMYQLAKKELQYLAEQPSPFLLTVFTAGAHVPFASPAPYYNMYSNQDYQGESKYVMASFGSVKEVMKNMQRDKHSFDIEQINALYDGTVKQFDDLVGEMLEQLKQLGIADNTLVVVFADHGVDLFEQESWGQGNLLYSSSYRVPLIIYDPRNQKNQINTFTTSSLDIAPTLLDALDLTAPEEMQGQPLSHADSSSVAFYESGMWLGNMPGLPKDRYVYPNITELLDIPNKEDGTFTIKPEYLASINRSRLKAVRKGPYQLERIMLRKGELVSCITDGDQAHECDFSQPPWQALADELSFWLQQEEQSQ